MASLLELLGHLRTSRECVLAGMQFDGRGPQFCGRGDLPFVRVQEQAHDDPRIAQTPHRVGHDASVRYRVQASFGRYLFATLGNQRGLVGAYLARDRDDIRVGRQFQVQLDRHRLAQQPQVPVLDVSTIFPQMDGDPVSPAQLGGHRRPHGVRFERLAGFPDCGHMIDIHS